MSGQPDGYHDTPGYPLALLLREALATGLPADRVGPAATPGTIADRYTPARTDKPPV